jgi:hypothetical protein
MPLTPENQDRIRLAIQDANTAFLRVEQTISTTETHAVIPNGIYARLANALTELMNVARRTL